MSPKVDIFIIGGGINGAGIARDAAGRGQTVMLVEQADLGSATSSASSKLIHGGLRYLEHYEFRLVRESLQERERLWKIAPHLIKPLRFVLPHHKGLRPAFVLRAGLFLYDHIGGRKLLPATKRLDLRTHDAGSPLQPIFKQGFEYSDCWVDDARLVMLNALGAAELGATVLTRHKFLAAERQGGSWHIETKAAHGEVVRTEAKALVNAAGPWVEKTLNACTTDRKTASSVRLVKGSHILVPRLYGHDLAYTFQNADGRIVFSIPYEGRFTLIGTTDTPFDADPGSARADADEIRYLCDAASEYFREPIHPTDVVWSYSGVRPLYDDGSKNASAATRDYVLELDAADGAPPLLTVFGGKITTYRRLAEEALEKLGPYLELARGKWTENAALPGGDLPGRDDPAAALRELISELDKAAPWLGAATLDRIARSYGTRAFRLLGDARSVADMGQNFGAGLYEKEIDFLRREEWAQSAEDILRRRSKLGLHMSAEERQTVAAWLGEQPSD